MIARPNSYNMPGFYTLPSARNMPPTPPEYHGSGTKTSWVFPEGPYSGSESRLDQILRPGPQTLQTSTFPQHRGLPEKDLHYYNRSQFEHNDRRPRVSQLPPLQYPAGQGFHQQGHAGQTSHSQSKPIEEKPTGGVSATLDYAMDRMIDFVAETAQGMYALYTSQICLADIDIVRSASSRSLVSPQFRVFVSQILSSTRLPSATIQLALHYLSTRLVGLSSINRFQSKYGHNSIYHMLTIALLLGSKFFDDNTFQNRSWSEVSSIPVGKINNDEIEWLLAIDWQLHSRHDGSDGWGRFETHWREWSMKKDAEMQLESLKLTPLEPSISQQPPFRTAYQGQVSYSRDPVRSIWDPTSMENPYTRYSRHCVDYSPPSAPHTGPNTPEWYNGFYGPTNVFAPQQIYHQAQLPLRNVVFTDNIAMRCVHEQAVTVRNSLANNVGCGCDFCSPYRATFSQSIMYDHRAIVGAT